MLELKFFGKKICLLPVVTIFTNMSILQVLGTMSIIWSVNDYFYIAGSLNAENLAGNMFVNFSLLSLTELPSVFIGQFLIGKEHYLK